MKRRSYPSDLTDSEELTWLTNNGETAKFVSQISDISSDLGDNATVEWAPIIDAYIKNHNLENKRGLILGKNLGGFVVSASINEIISSSENLPIFQRQSAIRSEEGN